MTFAVSDSGIGLSLAEIRRLFKPFSQANVSIASRFGGAGLGLSSVKQLARAMGGDISANQRSGGGMTFVLTVTLKSAEGSFDAVLMDMVLPGISGIEAIRRIRAMDGAWGRIAIIGVSGRAEDEGPSRAAGASAFLTKPVSPRGLATVLLQVVKR